jgi:hypothetical protein
LSREAPQNFPHRPTEDFLNYPLLETTRFWLGAGFAVGIVGTFFFTVALASIDPNDYYEEE